MLFFSAMREYGPDKTFLSTVAIIVLAGLFIFTSASFGLLARDGASFGNVAFNQLVLGLLGGVIVAFIVYKIPYKFFQRYSIYIFSVSIILTMLVFVPHLGFSSGGARRWIDLGPVSFQPAELLKLGFILMC